MIPGFPHIKKETIKYFDQSEKVSPLYQYQADVLFNPNIDK